MNLTGGQIQIVLDNLLYRALESIISDTTVFDAQIAHILSRITLNKKRKLVSSDRESAISLLCSALVEKDCKLKFEYIKRVKMERSVIHRFLSNIQKDLKIFEELYHKDFMNSTVITQKRLNATLKMLGSTDAESLFSASKKMSEFLESYYLYRDEAVSHYIKLSHKVSNTFRSSKTNDYDTHDVLQNFLSAVTKAIDKYDSSKGALTSYVNYWLLNAQTCNSNSSEYGIAYTIPHGKKRSMVDSKSNVNFSVSLESDHILDIEHSTNVHESVEKEDEHSIIQYLIKTVDKYGCFRLTYDIGEYFSKTEYQRMKEAMRSDAIKNCKEDS